MTSEIAQTSHRKKRWKIKKTLSFPCLFCPIGQPVLVLNISNNKCSYILLFILETLFLHTHIRTDTEIFTLAWTQLTFKITKVRGNSCTVQFRIAYYSWPSSCAHNHQTLALHHAVYNFVQPISLYFRFSEYQSSAQIIFILKTESMSL